MSIQKIFIGIFISVTTLSASAVPTADALTSCITDNTTGKERKEMVKFIFMALASHPEIKEISKITESDREKTYQAFANTLTRLLTQNCAEETRNSLKTGSKEDLQSAFRAFGQLGARELMTNPDVATSLSNFERYLDTKKLEALAPVRK